MIRPRALTSMMVCLAALACGGATAFAQDPAPTDPSQTTTASGGADASAPAAPAAPQQNTGGREYGEDDPEATPTVAGSVATIVDGIAYAPADAPPAVQQIIWAGNKIVGMPYVYGGGHKSFIDDGYDCSGTVSFALNGGGLLRRPRDSSDFYRFGAAGAGTWVTIFTNPGHAYMTVAGIRLDTSKAGDPHGGDGPQWRPLRKSDSGYKRRHPVGL